MAPRALRLLHASDFRLDTPCLPLLRLPAAIGDLHVEARYSAVTRLVDAAIDQQVDLVVLAGGLLDVTQTGLRGPWHLVEQFGRLQDAGIDVVWGGAQVDSPHRWPAYVGLPGNVRRFAPSARTPFRIDRPGCEPLLIGGCHASFPPTADGIRVVIAPNAPETVAVDGVDYIACGGRATHLVMANRRTAWPGSPQGRSSADGGPHGGLLVSIAPQDGHERTVHIEPIACDVVRFENVAVTPSIEATYDSLLDRIANAVSDHSSSTELTFLTVEVQGQGLAVERLRSPRRQHDLLRSLQEAESTSSVWPIAIEVAEAVAAAPDPDILETVAQTEATALDRSVQPAEQR